MQIRLKLIYTARTLTPIDIYWILEYFRVYVKQ